MNPTTPDNQTSPPENRGERFILAAGMPRSGSTWLYNVARLILEANFTESECWCGWIEDFRARTARRVNLVKLHEFDDRMAAMADTILYCYRDVRDVLASYDRMWGTPPTVEAAEGLLRQFDRWMEVQTCVVRYDELVGRPERVIAIIAKSLGFQVDTHHLTRRLADLSFQSSGSRSDEYHKVNLYHPKHTTHGGHATWHGKIDPRVIAEIESRFGDWFERYSYLSLTR